MCIRASALLALILFWPVFEGAANGQRSAGQRSDIQIAQFFRAGQTAMQQGQFTLAVQDFQKVLQADPTLLEAQVNLGLAYQGLFDYESATRYLSKALRERPNLLGPTVIVGIDYVKLGSPEKGIPFLRTALKLDSSNRDAREALASSYLAQDNFQGAAEQFRLIASLETDKAEAWFRLGHAYLDLAARLAYRGAHLYPDSAWGHRFLGDLVYQRERWQQAVEEYQKALAAEPKQPGLHVAIGQAYLHAGDLERAEAEFQSERQSNPESEGASLGLAALELARNQPTAALQGLEKVWELSPETLAVQREFPSIELPADSARALLSGVQDTPEEPPKHFLLAALSSAVNDNARADNEWRAFQTTFSLWQNQKRDLVADQNSCRTHQYSRCIDWLQHRKQLADSERLELGKAHFTLQHYEAAADALSQVHGDPSENAQASYWLEHTYQALGAETYARLEESFPESWRTHQLRAEGNALRGNVKDAVHEFHAALALRPDQPELHEALGELYLDNKDFEAAQHELEQTLAADSSRTHTLYLLGRAFVEQKHNEKALPYLERAVRLQPDLAEANSLLGTAYLRLGQFANAVPKLERAAASDHYGNVHYQLSVAYRRLGQSERAHKELLLSQNLHRSYLERDQAMIMGAAQPDLETQTPQ